MKKFMMIILLLALGTGAFAQEIKEMDREAVSLANMITRPSVLKCVEQIQKEKQAQFVIDKIKKTEVPDSTKYEIEGVLLVGGDVAVGYATIDVAGSFEPFFGFVYRCEIRKTMNP